MHNTHTNLSLNIIEQKYLYTRQLSYLIPSSLLDVALTPPLDNAPSLFCTFKCLRLSCLVTAGTNQIRLSVKLWNNLRNLSIYRVRSDKDRTGTITIVPVRTGTVILEKYRKF